MDDFNTRLDRIQQEFEALQRQVKAQNSLHLQSLAEQREAITSAFSAMQRSFAKLERTFADVQSSFTNVQSSFTNVQDSLANVQDSLANVQDGLANVQDGLANVQDGLKETQENTSRGFGQVHTALWRHELLLKDLAVQTESRFGIVGDVLDLTRSQNSLMEQRWSDLDERVRRLEERDPPAA